MKSILNFVAANVNSLILKMSEPTHVGGYKSQKQRESPFLKVFSDFCLKLACLTALTQPSPPRESFCFRRPSEKSAAELSGHAFANPKPDTGDSLSPGERAGVRADVAVIPNSIMEQKTARIPSNLKKSGLEKGKSGLEIAKSGFNIAILKLQIPFSGFEITISNPQITISTPEITISKSVITISSLKITILNLEITISEPEITVPDLEITMSELEIVISKALLVRKMVKNRHLTMKCPRTGQLRSVAL